MHIKKIQLKNLSHNDNLLKITWLTCSRAGSASKDSTRSLHCTESPATLPSAQAACSRTSSLPDMSNWMKMGTAPDSMTYLVWSDVPDAMFVKAQAASNCNDCEFAHTPPEFANNSRVSFIVIVIQQTQLNTLTNLMYF